MRAARQRRVGLGQHAHAPGLEVAHHVLVRGEIELERAIDLLRGEEGATLGGARVMRLRRVEQRDEVRREVGAGQWYRRGGVR